HQHSRNSLPITMLPILLHHFLQRATLPFFHHRPCFSLLITRLPPTSTLFPYTTLFRSGLIYEHDGDINNAFIAYRNAADVYLNRDRKSTRLNSSHVKISYAVFCLKKKKDGDS